MQFAFRAVPVFQVKAVLPAAGLPVGIGEAGDLRMGWGRRGNGRRPVDFAACAANLGSFTAMGHGFGHQ
jgi:hypothetical protein